MMKGRKIYSKLSILIIIIMLVTGTQVLAASSTRKPTKVTDLKANNITRNSVYLTWKKVSGATGYKVYIEVPGYGYSSLGIVNETYKTITGLDSITAYKSGSNIRAKVIATNNKGDAPEAIVSFNASGSSDGGSSNPVLSKVTNIRMRTNGSDTVILDFNKVSGAAKYQVFRKTANTSYKSLGYIEGTAGGVILSELSPGTTYYVKMRAIDSNGKPGPDSADFRFTTNRASSSSKPAKVTGLHATNITNSSAKIVWNKSARAKGYEVYIDIPAYGYLSAGKTTATYMNFKSFNTLDGFENGIKFKVKVVAFNDSGKALESEEYEFKTPKASSNSKLEYRAKIIAYNNGGDGPESAEYKFNTPAKQATVGTVSGISANAGTTTADISWDAVPGATKYEVYYRLANKTQGYSKTTTGTSIQITGLAAGSVYYVNVKAFNGNISGPYNASPVSFTTKSSNPNPNPNPGTTKPGKVTGVEIVSVTKDSVSLKYNSVSGADGYRISIIPKNTGSSTSFTSTQTTATSPSVLTSSKDYTVLVEAYKVVNGKNVYGDMSDAKVFKTKIDAGRMTEVKYSDLKANSVKLIYNSAVPYLEGYNTGYAIYIKEPGQEYPANPETTTSKTFNCNGLKGGTRYIAKVVPYKINIHDDNDITYGTGLEVSFTTLGAGLAKVSNVKTSNVTENLITVIYDPVNLATGYTVYLREAGKNYASRSISTKSTSAIFSGLQSGKKYYIKVEAIRVINGTPIRGEASDEIMVITNPKVKDVRAQKVTQYTAKVYWTPINITGMNVTYFIYTKSELDMTWRLATTIANPSGTIINLAPGHRYQIKVLPYLSRNGASYTLGTSSNIATIQM